MRSNILLGKDYMMLISKNLYTSMFQGNGMVILSLLFKPGSITGRIPY